MDNNKDFLEYLLDDQKAQMELEPFLFQFMSYFIVFVVLFVLFCVLRPINSNIYKRRIKVNKITIRNSIRKQKGLLTWLKYLRTVKMETIEKDLGLDAYIFLEFIAMEIKYSLIMTILAIFLLPLNYAGKADSKEKTKNNKTRILQFTILNNDTVEYFWIYIVVSWLSSIIFYYLLFRLTKLYVKMRQEYLTSEEYLNKINSRVLLITNLPKNINTKHNLEQFIKQLKIGISICNCSVSIKAAELATLVKEYNKNMYKLNSIMQKLAKKNNSKNKSKLGGLSVLQQDSLIYYSNKIVTIFEQINHKVSNTQIANFGFLEFKDAFDAHLASRMLEPGLDSALNVKNNYIKATIAPSPKDIIWCNIEMSSREKKSRKIIFTLVYVLLTIVSMFPIALIAYLTNVKSLNKGLKIEIKNKFLQTVIETSVGPILLMLYTLLIKKAFRKIGYFQSEITYTKIEQNFYTRFYSFNLYNNFFTYIILLTYFSLDRKILKSELHNIHGFVFKTRHVVTNLLRFFVNNVINSSSLWIVKISINTIMYMVEIIQPITLTKTFINKRRMKLNNKRKFSIKSICIVFDYSVIYATQTFNLTITMVFSILAPFFSIFSVMNFSLAYLVFKHQLIYVYIQPPKNNSGKMFMNVFKKTMQASIISQIITTIYIVGISKSIHQKYYMLSLPLVSIILYNAYSTWFGSKLKYIDLENYNKKHRKGKDKESTLFLDNRNNNNKDDNDEIIKIKENIKLDRINIDYEDHFEHPALKRELIKLKVPSQLLDNVPKQLVRVLTKIGSKYDSNVNNEQNYNLSYIINEKTYLNNNNLNDLNTGINIISRLNSTRTNNNNNKRYSDYIDIYNSDSENESAIAYSSKQVINKEDVFSNDEISFESDNINFDSTNK